MGTSNFYVDSAMGSAPRGGHWPPLGVIRKKCLSFFQRAGGAGDIPEIDNDNSLELRREYRDLVVEHCRRHGIDPAVMRVKALSLGYRRAREVYVVLVTVTQPSFEAAVQLAHLAPHMEKKIADIVGSTWLGDYSHFSGVWLHWPEQLHVPGQVRTAMHAVHQLDDTRPAALPAQQEH